MKISHYWISKLLLICLLCLLEFITIFPVKAQANQQENISGLTGTYEVNIITHPNFNYSKMIGIEDLGDGKIKVFGNFDGIPLSAIGHQTGMNLKTGSVYGFKINMFKLFNGTASMTFQYQNHNYQLSAEGKGTYDYQGDSGHGSARITGQRVSSSLPAFGIAAIPAFFGTLFKTHPLLGGLGLIIILLMIWLWIRYRKNHPAVKLNSDLKYQELTRQPLSHFDILAGLSLFILALAVRLPWLWEVPRYVDELKEVNLAYSIYLGQILPLHNVAHDIGSMHNYLLAGIFKLLGPSIYWPRLYVAVTAALTVVLLYFLGKKLFDRWTGLLAAAFLLTNGMHILITHKAWANCTTPFFFMLAMLATVNAEQKKSGKWLVLAGLLWAATLQTHSSVIIYLLVVLVYVLSRRFRRSSAIKTRWYWGAIFAFLAGYSNMIYYNIISAGGSIKWLLHKQYALESHPGIYAFVNNLLQMGLELLRSVSSTYGIEKYTVHYLLHPAFLLSLILIGAGGYWAVKKGRSLPVWMLLGGMAIMPWINHRYEFFLATRYIMPLVLCAILLMAYSIIHMIKLLIPRIKQPRLLTIPAATLLMILLCCQLLIFYYYCNRVNSTNLSNRTALQVISVIQKDYRSGSLILIDSNLQLENQPLPDLLAVSRVNYVVIPANIGKNKINNVELPWIQAINRYPNKHIIAIMNQSNYLALKNHLTAGAKTYSFVAQVVFPGTVPFQRVIYVVELKNGSIL